MTSKLKAIFLIASVIFTTACSQGCVTLPAGAANDQVTEINCNSQTWNNWQAMARELHSYPELKVLRLDNVSTGAGGAHNLVLESYIVNNPKLTHLYASGNYIESFGLHSAGTYTNLSNLQYIDFSNNDKPTGEYDFSHWESGALDILKLNNAGIDSADLETLPSSLTRLGVAGNGIDSLGFLANTPALETLDLDRNDLVDADLSSLSALVTLSIRENSLTSIDLTQNYQLEELLLGNNSLNTVELTKNNLNTVDLTNNDLLNFVDIENNGLTTIASMEFLTNLDRVFLSGNDQLPCDELDAITVSGNYERPESCVAP